MNWSVQFKLFKNISVKKIDCCSNNLCETAVHEPLLWLFTTENDSSADDFNKLDVRSYGGFGVGCSQEAWPSWGCWFHLCHHWCPHVCCSPCCYGKIFMSKLLNPACSSVSPIHLRHSNSFTQVHYFCSSILSGNWTDVRTISPQSFMLLLQLSNEPVDKLLFWKDKVFPHCPWSSFKSFVRVTSCCNCAPQ